MEETSSLESAKRYYPVYSLMRTASIPIPIRTLMRSMDRFRKLWCWKFCCRKCNRDPTRCVGLSFWTNLNLSASLSHLNMHRSDSPAEQRKRTTRQQTAFAAMALFGGLSCFSIPEHFLCVPLALEHLPCTDLDSDNGREKGKYCSML